MLRELHSLLFSPQSFDDASCHAADGICLHSICPQEIKIPLLVRELSAFASEQITASGISHITGMLHERFGLTTQEGSIQKAMQLPFFCIT